MSTGEMRTMVNWRACALMKSHRYMTRGHSCHVEMTQGYQASAFSRKAGHLDFNIVSFSI